MSNTHKPSDLSQTTSSEILRDPHEPEDNFSILPNELIRDSTLSLEARALMCYFLSFSRSWIFRMNWVMKDQKIGKDKFYRLLKDLIKSGYMKMDEILIDGPKGGKVRRVRYLFSKFKKFYRRPENPDPGFQDTGKPDTKNTYFKKTVNTKIKEDLYISTKPVHNSDQEENTPPLSEASHSAKASFSADASEIYNHFLSKIRERKPDFKEPKEDKWTAEIDRMLRIDKRDKQKTISIISWLIKDDFWFGNVLSPQKLRIQYDQLEIKMRAFEEEQKKDPNKRLYYETRNKDYKRFKNIIADKKGITDLRTGKDALWTLPQKTFGEILANMLGARFYEHKL